MKEQMKEANGIIVVNKPEGLSSHRVVNRIRNAYGTKTVGHCGTLDPLATGVLPVMVGRAVKASEFLMDHDKSYRAGIEFGYRTDSGDITGKVIERSEKPNPEFEEFKAVAESFKGSYLQTPPMYSALKVDGMKLLTLARQGIEVERQAREITVYDIKASEQDGKFFIDVSCSRGTYIRTLCEDIAEKLGTFAVMSSLERTSVGQFDSSQAISLDELDSLEPEERLERLVPVESVFTHLPIIKLVPFFEKLFKNGAEVYLKKIRAREAMEAPVGSLYRIYGEDGFFAVGETALYRDGLALRIKKIFYC